MSSRAGLKGFFFRYTACLLSNLSYTPSRKYPLFSNKIDYLCHRFRTPLNLFLNGLLLINYILR